MMAAALLQLQKCMGLSMQGTQPVENDAATGACKLEEAKLHGAVCDFGKRWHHDERAAWLHEFVSVQSHVRVSARPLPVRTRARARARKRGNTHAKAPTDPQWHPTRMGHVLCGWLSRAFVPASRASIHRKWGPRLPLPRHVGPGHGTVGGNADTCCGSGRPQGPHSDPMVSTADAARSQATGTAPLPAARAPTREYHGRLRRGAIPAPGPYGASSPRSPEAATSGSQAMPSVQVAEGTGPAELRPLVR
mmetsp:Transcript_26854/g.80891  ORF Transcript_26854/g.80891 Transcript_26854/m.80891 type:complete len:249 (+) Transcript_26854:67-813(+)